MTTPSLNNLSKITKNATGNMKVGVFYFCDLCHNPIYNKEDGFVIHGNIYKADPTCRSGLIGNNFPHVTTDQNIKVEDVLEKVYCIVCFCKVLGISKHKIDHDKYGYKKAQGVFTAPIIAPDEFYP